MSKAKGNMGERIVANLLSARFEATTGLKQAFRRATDSGAYFGKSNIRRLISTGSEHATFGDILTPRNFKFVIEVKSYKDSPSLAQIFRQKCAYFEKWIEQVDTDAGNAAKIPALIIRWNHCPALVFLPDGLNLDYTMRYRDRIVLTLEDWLRQKDDHFFNTE